MVTAGKVRRAKEKAVGGKRDRCRKGKSCSATCISGLKVCLVELPGMVSTSLSNIKGKLKDKIRNLRPKPKVKEEPLKPQPRPRTPEDIERAKSRDMKYNRAVDKILGSMEAAAARGKKGTYEKLERQFLTIQSKGGERFKKVFGTFEKGEVWKSKANNRKLLRDNNIRRAHDLLVRRAEEAARNKERAKYLEIEKTILKVQEKAGNAIKGPNQVSKGVIWGKENLPAIRQKLIDNVIKEIAAGNKEGYLKAMQKITRIGEKLDSYKLKDLGKEDLWTNYNGLAQFLTRLKNSDLKNGREGVTDIKMTFSGSKYGQAVFVRSNIRGNTLKLEISAEGLSFTVNDRYTARDDISRADKVAIIKEVRRQFTEVTKSLADGTYLAVFAAEGDGREGMRQRGYESFGFSPPTGSEGTMYGVVRNGKIVPTTPSEYEGNASTQFKA
jgi:hypothetical protein